MNLIKNNTTTIGGNIKIARQLRKISQRVLADKIGLTWEMISRYETGKVNPINSLGKISRALNIPISFLLGETSLLVSDNKYVDYYSKEIHFIPFVSNYIKLFSENAYKTESIRHLAPLWMSTIQLKNSFAIDSLSASDPERLGFHYNGIFIVLRNNKYKTGDIVLCGELDISTVKLEVRTYNRELPKDLSIIGKLLSFERIFS